MGNTQTKKEPKTLRAWLRQLFPFSWRDLGVSISFLGLAAILCALLRMIDSSDVFVALIFECAVVLVSRFTDGYLFGLLASFLSVFGVNWIFTYPYMQLNFTISGYPLTFLIMLAVSVVVSALITQIKRQEQQRCRAQVEEMQANLLRAVSHDLRTPLTSISGAASVLIAQPEMDAAGREKLLREIVDDSDWLVRMVENLLSITRINAEPANLNKRPEAAEEIIAESVRKFRKRFAEPPVEIRLPDELVMVPMDPILIEQVLTNLLENVARHARATEVRVSLRAVRDQAVFEVADNGVGLPPKQIRSIFDPIPGRGVSDGSRSMGIGLSVCRAIILAHGGAIEAENLPEGGACFRFCLPLKEEHYEFNDDHTDR